MKETQSEDQGSKRNRREAQCHQGRGAVCPPLLGAQSLQQSLAQTRGWRQWEEGNGGAEQGLWSLNWEGGSSLGLLGDSSKEPDLSEALKGKRESGPARGWESSMAGRGSHLEYPEERVGQGVLTELLRKGPRVEPQNTRARSTDPDTRSMRSCGRILRGETEALKKKSLSLHPTLCGVQKGSIRCYRAQSLS